jgi:serine protease Do
MSVRSLNWLKFGGLVALAFALGLLFAGLLDLPRSGVAQQLARNSASIAPVPPPSIPEAKPLADLSDAFAAVADAVVPSVVYIRAQRQQSGQRRIPPGLEQFFGPQREPGLEQGSGSGFVVSADGYILTNNHVVEGAERVIVRLHDRREFDAKVIGTDANTDIAVLKIESEGLKPAALGNSDNEKIGEWVLAVGNPLNEGLTFTVTSGIISAKGRQLQDLPGTRTTLNISDFIQTDAAINPGNSGGPLVNVRGEVIGVNSAIATQTGTYTGYGFAIPINLVRDVMRQLISDGRVHRAGIGITIEEAGRYDAQYVGLDRIGGVLVQSIAGEDSPAGKAGIEPGDVIIAVDGKPIDRVGQLQQEIGFREPGQTVKVEVARKGGVRRTFDVRLQALNGPEEVAQRPDTIEAEGAASTSIGAPQNLLGARTQQLTPALSQRLGVPAGTQGVMLTDVTPGSPAWEAGLLEPGRGAVDVIQRVDGRGVSTEAELSAALRRAGPRAIVSLDVLRVLGNGASSPYIRRLRLGDSAR